MRRSDPNWPYGEQTRDFVPVTDVAHFIRRALEAPEPFRGAVFNLASGEAARIIDVARKIMARHGLDGDPELTPPRPGDIRHSVADITRLRNWGTDTKSGSGQ